MKAFSSILFFLIVLNCNSQTLGGSSVYNFLHLTTNPLLTAEGGVNISYRTDEVGIVSSNPSLLNKDVLNQMNASFASFPGGFKTYALTSAIYSNKLKAFFGGHIFFVDYGSIPQTDAAGNILGNFHPSDYVIQASASAKYMTRWWYGASIKLIASSYGQYKSIGMAVDFGVNYFDSTNGFSASLVSANMGSQLKTYAGGEEDLPFDLQIGITKKLAKAPFAFSFTARHVHQFNIVYYDTSFQAGINQSNSFVNKLLDHFVIATHIFINENLEATLGYNHLQRMELNMGSSGNGLNGFSTGIRIKFQKIQILYARSNYQRNISFNHFGITIQLNKIFSYGEL